MLPCDSPHWLPWGLAPFPCCKHLHVAQAGKVKARDCHCCCCCSQTLVQAAPWPCLWLLEVCFVNTYYYSGHRLLMQWLLLELRTSVVDSMSQKFGRRAAADLVNSSLGETTFFWQICENPTMVQQCCKSDGVFWPKPPMRLLSLLNSCLVLPRTLPSVLGITLVILGTVPEGASGMQNF